MGFGVRLLGRLLGQVLTPLKLCKPEEPSVQRAHPTGLPGCPGEAGGGEEVASAQTSGCLFAISCPCPRILVPVLSLAPRTSPPLASLPPSQTLSLPGAQMCGKRRREFRWGNLLDSHNPASARIFSLSLNLPRFVILLLSPSIQAAGLGRHPAPPPRAPALPAQPGHGCLAGEGGGKSSLCPCLSFFTHKKRRVTVATSQVVLGIR